MMPPMAFKRLTLIPVLSEPAPNEVPVRRYRLARLTGPHPR